MAKPYYYRAGKTPVASYFLYLYHKTLDGGKTDLVFESYSLLNTKWALMNELLRSMGQNPYNPLVPEILRNCYLFAKKMGW